MKSAKEEDTFWGIKEMKVSFRAPCTFPMAKDSFKTLSNSSSKKS